MKREGFKGLHVENQFFHDVKYLVASMSKYQVFVQFFSFATIAIKNWSVSAKDAEVEVDEPWVATLAWDFNIPLAWSHGLSLQSRTMCPFFPQ